MIAQKTVENFEKIDKIKNLLFDINLLRTGTHIVFSSLERMHPRSFVYRN